MKEHKHLSDCECPQCNVALSLAKSQFALNRRVTGEGKAPRVRFCDLDIGEQFEFATKTDVGCGKYNGVFTKTLPGTYRGDCFIGHPQTGVEVLRVSAASEAPRATEASEAQNWLKDEAQIQSRSNEGLRYEPNSESAQTSLGHEKPIAPPAKPAHTPDYSNMQWRIDEWSQATHRYGTQIKDQDDDVVAIVGPNFKPLARAQLSRLIAAAPETAAERDRLREENEVFVGALLSAEAENNALREQYEASQSALTDVMSELTDAREQVKELLAAHDKYEASANTLFHERDELLAALKDLLNAYAPRAKDHPFQELHSSVRAALAAIAKTEGRAS